MDVLASAREFIGLAKKREWVEGDLERMFAIQREAATFEPTTASEASVLIGLLEYQYDESRLLGMAMRQAVAETA